MSKRNLAIKPRIWIDGVQKLYSHYVWHENTEHWPVSGEVIHHIDGNHQNDEFSNLQLMSLSEHTCLHWTGRSHSEETRAKMSAAKMGKRSNAWKGDDASPHAKYMRIWRAKRRADREGNTKILLE